MLLQLFFIANIVFQNFINGLDVERLQAIALELLLRQPAAFNDLVNGQIAPGDGQPDPPDPPPDGVPDWCKCGHCVAMPTQEENKCCSRAVRPCITTSRLFPQLVLDANALDLAMRY